MTWGTRHLNRVASVGLTLVVVLLAAFALWTSTATQQTTERVEASVHSTDALRRVAYAFDLQSSARYRYWAIRDTTAQQDLRQSVATVWQDLGQAERFASLTQDHGIGIEVGFGQLRRQERRYVSATRPFVEAVRRGDDDAAGRIEKSTLAPLQRATNTELGTAAQLERREVFDTLSRLQQRQVLVGHLTIVVFPIGLILLLTFAILRVRAIRLQEAHRGEVLRLEREALTDSITGLGNHRAFHEEIRREMARSLRHGTPLTLALIDVDEFKLINDQHGHAHGDRVLARLAALLQTGRGEDRPFRLGGDEFAVILPHTDIEQARAAVDRLRGEAGGRLFGSTISAGITALTTADTDLDTLREQADAALYEAKRRGRNTVVAFAEISDAVSIMSTAKIAAVRRLLAERDVSIVFQPIWDLERGRVMAYEALMRPAEKYALGGPHEAFDIAERLGRAHELDTVCRNATLKHAYDLPADTLLFINVAPQSLDHDTLAGSSLQDEVLAAGLSPNRVVLEITERAMPHLATIIREARRLRELGFRVALDDVGSGNAGLEVLRRLQVDFVKIDRSVVVEARTSSAARAVLAGIIAFSRQSNSFLIAEGIEDEAMLAYLRHIEVQSASKGYGIDGGQGYLLGRPGPIDGTLQRQERHATA